MKYSAILLALLGVLHANLCLAQNTTGDTLPACGLLCIVELTSKSTCDLSNSTCICTNAELSASIAACVSANCTIRESLSIATEKFAKVSCGVKPRDRTKSVAGIGVTFSVVALIVFGLRIISRLKTTGGTLGLDDLVMTVVALELVPIGVLSVSLADHGLGLDLWNVSFINIEKVLYLFFWDELIYLSALPLTKISILLFYIRIFPGQGFRYCVYVLIAANVMYLISFEIVSIWQCQPVKAAWERWDGEFPCTCNNINLQGWLSAAFNIVLDVGMLSLPMPELYRLNMSRKKKIHIMMMFGVGFFVVIVSILRLKSLIRFANTTNFTQDYTDVGIWSTIEVPVGVICACMPSLRSLLGHIFPKLFSSTTNGTSTTSSMPRSRTLSNVPKSLPVSSKTHHENDGSFVELVELNSRDTNKAWQ